MPVWLGLTGTSRANMQDFERNLFKIVGVVTVVTVVWFVIGAAVTGTIAGCVGDICLVGVVGVDVGIVGFGVDVGGF